MSYILLSLTLFNTIITFMYISTMQSNTYNGKIK